MSISIVTIEPGKRYHIFVSAGRDEAGKRVRVSERFTGRKVDAMKRARAMATEHDTGRYVSRRPETFGAFIASWWPTKLDAIAPTTAQGYRQLLDAYILPALDTRPIQKITGTELSRIVNRESQTGHLALADHLFVVLKLIFNAALKQGRIGRHPLTGVERPKVPRREIDVMTADDWRRAREHLAATSPWAVRPLSLLLTTGMRRSELCGLQWRDIDFAKPAIHVRRSYHVLAGRGGIHKEPKSTRSRRAIDLDSNDVELLRERRAEAEHIAGLFGRRVADTDPVFANARNEPWAPDSLTGVWRRSAAALDPPLSSRLHSLRHSSATLMLATGVPPQVVSERLGHATAGFTLTVYAGFLPGAQAEAAKKLGALLTGHTAQPAAGTAAAG